MKDTFTTVVEQQGEHIEIVTLHDQTGSASIGTVPLANIPKLIEGLKKFISFQPRVMLSFPSDEEEMEHNVSGIKEVPILKTETNNKKKINYERQNFI